MTLKEILEKFGKVDGSFVIENMMGLSQTEIFFNQNETVPKDIEIKIDEIYENYSKDYPINYLIGKKNFYGRDFYLEDGVLIPRFETEILIENILSLGVDFENILDIGCGSGIISITLALEMPKSKVLGVDISEVALDISNRNRELLGARNSEFKESNLFSSIGEEKFDLIVSNPPYINREDMKALDERVKKEPELALFGGEDGLDFYKAIIEKSHEHLNENGYIAFEIGYNQGESVKELLSNNEYGDVNLIKDYNGFDRCVIARSMI
ncbi:peptide chain release factor N(5)-glutamine methyltransferase [Mediannikoviicoccus vaginalis]|uniref:peptide chain release factor N(5)-glutamine methyltransferase n=1 Tax=Mediannikoviicoccus vaginalis TaxID=2899727 RepID=UPI001F013281|nr:peptide chain release factor N(5)-glutamine methyltransferase [Mediannikoviicoccus vaginalis]